jgi:hypothetical protein
LDRGSKDFIKIAFCARMQDMELHPEGLRCDLRLFHAGFCEAQRNPMTGIADCCARTASRHAAAEQTIP